MVNIQNPNAEVHSIFPTPVYIANLNRDLTSEMLDYLDGQEFIETGTFTNSTTQLIFYPTDGSAATLWNTTKINCLEFDGNGMDAGIFYEIELDYYSAKLTHLEKTPTISKIDVKQIISKK